MSTPVKFLELTIRNFMSYGNNETKINLDFKEPILIIGRNHDAIVNGQVDSNGAGKCLRANTTVEVNAEDSESEKAFLKFLSKKRKIMNSIKCTVGDVVEFYKQHPEYIGKLNANTRWGYHTISYADVTARNSNYITITTDTGKIIEGSPDHKLMRDNDWVCMKELRVGDRLLNDKQQYETITCYRFSDSREDLYDLEVDSVHEFYANGIVSHNSAILDALAYALYDRTISNKEKANLINNVNKKNLEVSLTFEKNGTKYKTIRMRKTKTKADVQLLVENKKGEYEDKTPDSISNTNKELERIVGLPFDVFARIIVFSATFQPFLDLPSRHASKASQTSIMEELFGYTELTEKAEHLKEKIRGVKGEFEHIKDLQGQVEKEKERHAKQLEDAKMRIENWEQSQNSKIEEARSKLESLNKIDIELAKETYDKNKDKQKRVDHLRSELNRLRSEKKSLQESMEASEERTRKLKEAREKIELIEKQIDFDKEEAILSELNEAEETLNEKHKAYADYESEMISIKEKVKKIKQELESLKNDECPYCKQQMHDADNKIAELSRNLDDYEQQIESLDSKRKKTKEKIAKIDDDIVSVKMKSIVKGDSSDLQKIKDKYNRFQTIIESYADEKEKNFDLQLDEKREEIEELDKEYSDLVLDLENQKGLPYYKDLGEIERIVVQKEHLETTIKDMQSAENPHTEVYNDLLAVTFEDDYAEKLNTLEVELRHQEFLLRLLTKKDSFVRKNLLDRSLPFLNKRLMVYLEKLGLPHRVEFEPDMSAKISRFGTELDFSSLSSGQRARVNLALAFAFRDVLQARHGKISFCMLDECLDIGLGNVGVQLAAKMIKNIANDENMSMFVISHRDEIASMFDNKLVVELENGFSRIVDQAA